MSVRSLLLCSSLYFDLPQLDLTLVIILLGGGGGGGGGQPGPYVILHVRTSRVSYTFFILNISSL